MSITRRLFGKAIPAFPLAASEAGRALGENYTRYPPIHGLKSLIEKDASLDPYQSKLSAFYKARTEATRASRYISQLNSIASNDYISDRNIAALRSVSAQHKAEMIMQRDIQRAKANQSITDKLVEFFGVKGMIPEAVEREIF